MNKLDIKIIDILGEYADKELKFGCMVEMIEEEQIRENVTILENKWETTKVYNWYYIEKYDSEWFYQNPEQIIWQYWLHNILMWMFKNKSTRRSKYINSWCILWLVKEHTEDVQIVLDITKPPMERSDEQKQEFIDFAEKIQ